MSTHRKSRGMRTQLLTAQYLAANGWPFAESTGPGRSGVDVTGTPDIAVECKARADWNPLAWVKQANLNADGRLPFVVSRVNGQGETPANWLAVLRFADLVDLLRAAGYGDPPDTLPTVTAEHAHPGPGKAPVSDEPQQTTHGHTPHTGAGAHRGSRGTADEGAA